jgi:hypothetical protein
MFKFSLDDYFKYLIELTPKKMEQELINSGWIHNPNKSKEYSKSFVDNKGELQNFNAVADEVEHVMLEL